MKFDDYKDCTKCPDLYKLRTQIVWGYGNEQCDVMFIAEGPGEHEDAEGVPFRRESGILLDQLLEEAGIDREEVYITNSVLCRPTRPSAAGHGLVNRPPTKLEVENCLPRLRREILAINPKIVVSLGDVAASALVGKKLGIKKSRGKMLDVYIRTDNGVVVPYAVMPVFHPAYLLRTRSQEEIRRTVWDLRLVINVLSRYKASMDTAHV